MNMKLSFYFFIILLAIFSCKGSNKGSNGCVDTLNVDKNAGAVACTDSTSNKKYTIKSGIVTFESYNMGLREKLILYFDDFGAKEVVEKYRGEKLWDVNLCDGKIKYAIFPDLKEAYLRGECRRGIAIRFDGDELFKSDNSGKKVSKLTDTTVAGKVCTMYIIHSKSMQTTYAGWNKVCLYQKIKTENITSTLTAIKFEENVSIPADKFKVPAEFKVK